MGQANPRNAVLLFIKIEPHQGLGRFLVPRWHPGEGEHARTFDDPIDAFDFERSSNPDAAHQPTAAGPKIGFRIRCFEAALFAPPLHPLCGIDQGLENPRGG